MPLCVNNPAECAASELAVWQEMQRAAEEEYDRTRNCSFTTFIGYENTSTPSGTNWHRNVIFRNDRVVKRPITAIDMAIRPNDSPTTGGPDGVGSSAELDRRHRPRRSRRVPGAAGDGRQPSAAPAAVEPPRARVHPRRRTSPTASALRCDFVTIPHNSNLGGGVGLIPPMFLDPFNKEDARRHQRFEPLVEIYQDKGSSECRFDPRFRSGAETRDEFCSFEILDTTVSDARPPASAAAAEGGAIPPQDFNERAYVRNVWKDGLLQAQQQWQGVNPFKMGVVASSDSHTGVMGWHPETKDWPGHLGLDDAWPMERPSTIQNSSGGHSVVWAEENSRDSIFEALKRKETYGTSGTRIVVRFFGGWDFAKNLCQHELRAHRVREGRADGRRPAGAAERGRGAALHRGRLEGRLHRHGPGAGPDHQGLGDSERARRRRRSTRSPGTRATRRTPRPGIDKNTCETKPGGLRTPLRRCGRIRTSSRTSGPSTTRACSRSRSCRYSTLWCRERIGVDPLDLNQCQKDLERDGGVERPAPAGERGARSVVLQQPDDLAVRAAGDPGAGLDVADLVRALSREAAARPGAPHGADRGAALRGRRCSGAGSRSGSGPGSSFPRPASTIVRQTFLQDIGRPPARRSGPGSSIRSWTRRSSTSTPSGSRMHEEPVAQRRLAQIASFVEANPHEPRSD